MNMHNQSALEGSDARNRSWVNLANWTKTLGGLQLCEVRRIMQGCNNMQLH
jgi:hypothetical protein